MRFLGSRKQLPPDLPGVAVLPSLWGMMDEGHSPSELIRRYVGWVYTCVRINAEAAASVPLRLYRKGTGSQSKTAAVSDKRVRDLAMRPSLYRHFSAPAAGVSIEEVAESPLLTLLEQINPHMNQFEFIEGISTYNDLTGNTFIYMLDAGGPPIELWILPTQMIELDVNTKGRLVGYKFNAGAQITDYKVEEIIHTRMFNPHDPYYGYAALRAGTRAADLLQVIKEYEGAILQNMGRPDILISLEGNPGPNVRERFMEWWKKTFLSHKKAGGVGVLPSPAKVDRLGMTGQEMSYQEGVKAYRTEVCGVFGVPEALIVCDDANLANEEGSRRFHARNTIFPRLKRIEQKLNEVLVPRFGEDAFLAFDNPVPEMVEQELAGMRARVSLGVTAVNEERHELNRAPLDIDEAKVPMVPLNTRPMGSNPKDYMRQGSPPRGETDNERQSDRDKAFDRLLLMDREATHAGDNGR